jgi:hypothetical protein
VDSSIHLSLETIKVNLRGYDFIIRRFDGNMSVGDFFVNYYRSNKYGLVATYKMERDDGKVFSQAISVSCDNGEIEANTVEILTKIQ